MRLMLATADGELAADLGAGAAVQIQLCRLALPAKAHRHDQME